MIRPTFFAFETAKRALSIGQAGLDTVGHNITNANTAGYTRQRVDQMSFGVSGLRSQYQMFGPKNVGMGATIQGVNQIRDPYLDNRYRIEASSNAEYAVKSEGLTDINNIFDEIETDGLYSKMDDLVNAINVLGQSADSKELAMIVRDNAKQLTQILNKNSQQLLEARQQETLDFTTTVDQTVNNILDKISHLNTLIKEENFYGSPSNELNDERNVLLDQLSEFFDIQVINTPKKLDGQNYVDVLSVEIKNSGDPPLKLIDDGEYKRLGVTTDAATGNVKVQLIDGISGLPMSDDISPKLQKGAVKGYIDIINGGGPTHSGTETEFRGIPYYQKALDEYAQQLAEVFNRVNNITEQEVKNAGTPTKLEATTDKNLFVPLSPTVTDASGNKPAWIDTVHGADIEFSGKDYPMSFSYAADGSMTATTPDGTVYTGTYTKNGTVDFKSANGKVAFRVKTTTEPPTATTDVNIDAKISARNITVAASWVDDPLYITTTKENPSDVNTTKLAFQGTSNPNWLTEVANGKDGVVVSNGAYQFTRTGDGTTADPYMVNVKIDGLEYSGEYKANSTIELKNSMTGKVGLVITTNSKAMGATDSENHATIRNTSGAKSDNLSKLLTQIKAPNNYQVSGINGNFQEFLIGFQSQMGLDLNLNTSLQNSSDTVIMEFADRRDAVSAVSVDEEGISMMQYQSFYNAAARYMTTLDEALDKIINGMGVVGR